MSDCDFDINPGEVVALIGDNGTGKSTLVTALSGNLASRAPSAPTASGKRSLRWTAGP